MVIGIKTSHIHNRQVKVMVLRLLLKMKSGCLMMNTSQNSDQLVSTLQALKFEGEITFDHSTLRINTKNYLNMCIL
jgi:hypothetical protein